MTFFSGTDLSTLRDEGKDYNHFLSLIVNNAGEYTAAITKKIKTSTKGTQSFSYSTFEDVPVNIGSSDFEEENTIIEYYPLKITVERVENPKSELELRLETVRASSNSYINKPFDKPTFPSQISPEKSEPTVIQKTLFTPEEMGEKKPISNNWEEDEIDYTKYHINPKILSDTITQIITGDIFSIYKQNIDLNKWVLNMEAIYTKRFGDISENDSFKYWVDTFIEFLENELYDEKLIGKGSDYMAAIWANDVAAKLETFPKNKYLNIFIAAFKRWLV